MDDTMLYYTILCMQYIMDERYNKSKKRFNRLISGSLIETRRAKGKMRFQFVIIISTLVVLVITHHEICVMRDPWRMCPNLVVKSFIDFTKSYRPDERRFNLIKYSFTLFLYSYCFVEINTKHEDGHTTLENGQQ